MAQRLCCGRVCKMCESPAEYAWRRRSVDMAALLADAVENDLSPNEREAVEKYWFEGKTLTRIGEETGRAPPNVLRTLERAKAKLHKSLRLAVFYQYDLEEESLVPLAVRKAAAVEAARRGGGQSPGERLKKLRLEQNAPLPLIAKASGLERERIEALENGTEEMTMDELLFMAAFFNTTADYILKGGADYNRHNT